MPVQLDPSMFGGGPGLSGYAFNPAPQSYNSTFGGVPGPVGMPSPYGDLSRVLPGLGGLNATASSDIFSQLQGNLSPGTQKLLQDQAANFGVSSGMPGSGLASNKYLRDLGLTSEQVVNQGISNYGKFVPTVSGTQTVPPGLQAQIAGRNALVNAAPNPSQAQSYAQSLFDKYLQMMRGPAGGTAGGATSPAGVGGGAGVGAPSAANQFDPEGDLLGWNLPSTPNQSASTQGIGPGIPFTDSSQATGQNLGTVNPIDWLMGGPGMNTTMSMFGLGNTMAPLGSPGFSGDPNSYAGKGYFADPFTGQKYGQLPSGDWEASGYNPYSSSTDNLPFDQATQDYIDSLGP